jgi:hypothetical protein
MPDTLTLSDEQREKVITTVKLVRQHLRWKPGKAETHLQTRKRYGHLAAETTLDDYHQIISTLVKATSAELYLYVWQDKTLYPTIVSEYNQTIWLVMVSLSGVLETAFPPTDPQAYLADKRFHYQGNLPEFLT